MRSLRVRLSAALLAALMVALVAISFETVRRAEAVLSPEIERKAVTLADSSAALIGKALALGIPAEKLHGLDEHFARLVAANDDVAWIALEGPDGAPLRIVFAEGEEQTSGGDLVSRPVPRAGPDAPAYTVTVGLDPAFAREVVSTLWIDLAIVMFVTAVVALELIYVGFGDGLYAAIEGVERRLHNISRGDLRSHQPVEARGEFGALARALDGRIERVHAAYAQIRDRAVESGDRAARQALEMLQDRFGLGQMLGAGGAGKVMAVRAPLFVFMLAEELTRPFLPVHVRALAQAAQGEGALAGMDPAFVAALPMMAFLAVVAICQPLLGGVTERIGRRRSLAVGGAVGLVGYAASAFADGLAVFAALRALTGFGFAMVFVGAQGYVIDATEPAQRSSGMAVFISAILVAGVCGPPIGGILVDRAGVPGTFLVAGLFAGLSLLLAWLVMPKAGPVRAGGPAIRWREFGRVVASPSLAALFFLCAMPAKIILVAFCFFLVPLQLEALGSTQAATGRMLMIYPIVMVLLVPACAKLADRWQARAGFVAAGGLVAGASAFALAGGGAQEPARIAVMLLGLGLGQAISIAALSGLVGDYGRRHAHEVTEGSVYGIFRLVERTGNALGPPVAGALLGLYGFAGAAMIVGGAVMACALAFGLAALALRPRDLEADGVEG
ncbi:MFS transporter [Albimonas sp. CAU 1670]|uniref:MFS transporter n=1 Tax=Albimonas sp. CAU 1670 TaxID=3032599 RepID=UPI0023DBC0C9|nr:MFS transporter [Albimonas sp. CAU 1670]MDF2233945.1 MFS transporter [Albimonas sp. CAU 1670]